MISEAVLAIEYKASAEDIARTSHAHPTLSEGTSWLDQTLFVELVADSPFFLCFSFAQLSRRLPLPRTTSVSPAVDSLANVSRTDPPNFCPLPAVNF